jgi:hypothetical protein
VENKRKNIQERKKNNQRMKKKGSLRKRGRKLVTEIKKKQRNKNEIKKLVCK